ncbi:replication initiation protein [Oceanobacillus oncorhynchi subsp. incaldanensis]|uniref:Replication initiation factor n=1 Tax=Oceanobacillus oncorhynchi TaxID=545501 RepID=A0A0A1MTV3_9BACI|nr:replication initiation protein [Oceanobacillus oncorhynchi subsp. incaldanensis]CEI82962.1 Replication initiation factor [Oceanobacillus oncorhynchi]
MYQMPWYHVLREKRLEYGVSQNKLAIHVGISRQYLSEIETGKVTPSEAIQTTLFDILEQFNPEAPLEILFDYVRIRFLTTNPTPVIEDILQLKKSYMLHEDFAFYSYFEQYVYGDIVVMVSPDEDKGCLLELKGKGCRQFENFLLAQQRTWFDFFMEVFRVGGVFKRIDLAINDKTGILDIPFLTQKCRNEECVTVFRNFKSYRSGELVHAEDKPDMGHTLYIGSLKSDVYFSIYEKDYEQYVKFGTSIEDTEVKNRFEIRLKNDRAYHAIVDLMTYEDAGKTAFSIINRYIRFVDKDEKKRRSSWKMNADWQRFLDLGVNRKISLTTKPEPYTFDKTLRWLAHQVAPTWKLATEVDEINQTTVIKDMLAQAELSDRHQKILLQQTVPVEKAIRLPSTKNDEK